MSGIRRAVVIGVNKYQDSNIRELKGAENDAMDIYKRLTDKDSGGIEISKEHYLIGDKATCDSIRKSISDLLWKMDKVDLSIFYFSGHGFHDGYGNGYIAPWDINQEEPLVRGIRMQELINLLLAAKKKETILLILDCCYSGIATEGKGDTDSGIEKPQFDQWFSSLGKTENGKGKFILASAGKNEKSHELLECTHTLSGETEAAHPHGAFTFHLLEGLDGKAATDGNDAITLDRLIKYVEKQMEDNPDHKPTLYGAVMNQTDNIVIARAFQWSKIDEDLKNVKQLMDTRDPLDVLFAASTIGEIIRKYTNLPEAIKLKSSIDQSLINYRNITNAWILNNRLTLLGYQYKDEFKKLSLLTGDLSVETLSKEDLTMRGLFLTLCVLALNNTPENLNQFQQGLSAYRSAQSQKTSTAKPDILGEQGVAKSGEL